jgi:hypothetical protein
VIVRLDVLEVRHVMRAGNYEMALQTKTDKVQLKEPKLQRQSGGCFGAPCRGNHRSALGHVGFAGDGF